jgi:hypothetical protein
MRHVRTSTRNICLYARNRCLEWPLGCLRGEPITQDACRMETQVRLRRCYHVLCCAAYGPLSNYHYDHCHMDHADRLVP